MPGLRELKKARTRRSIQEHALRLIAAQGYDETTVDQIAAAAEVSPSTFFRYFKTKEDAIIEDEFDPLIITYMRDQPHDLPPLKALRQALGEAFTHVGEDDIRMIRERIALIQSVPALRARQADQWTSNIDMIAALVAEHAGKDAGDVDVRVFAGALVGAWIAAIFTWAKPGNTRPLAEIMDRAMEQLERGLPL